MGGRGERVRRGSLREAMYSMKHKRTKKKKVSEKASPWKTNAFTDRLLPDNIQHRTNSNMAVIGVQAATEGGDRMTKRKTVKKKNKGSVGNSMNQLCKTNIVS